MGGWTAAKEAAGLETFEQGGGADPEPEPQPEGVDIPSDEEWGELPPAETLRTAGTVDADGSQHS